MIFGEVPLADAAGAILAHSVRLPEGRLAKGRVLSQTDIAALRGAGLETITVARLEDTDLSENAAAETVALALAAPGLRLSEVFTGRVNLIAEKPGVVRVDAAAVNAFNMVDEGLTLATLPDLMRVDADQLVGTVKIIPYGIGKAAVAAGVSHLGTIPVQLMPFQGGTVRLIQTVTPGFKDSLLTKGEAVVRARIEALGLTLTGAVTVPHEVSAVANALGEKADMILILGASATSDRADVAPAAVVAAGGQITRFGMPVDPGNLLFMGEISGAPVVGLPGCARSPALNGVDWVLERLAAKLPVSSADIAAMGVGGLLKEMPGRPQPRRPET